LNGGAPPSPEFTRLINPRFGPSIMDTHLGELALLHHTGFVDEFYTNSCRYLAVIIPSLSGSQFNSSPRASVNPCIPMLRSSTLSH
jgi:hypothetical protein